MVYATLPHYRRIDYCIYPWEWVNAELYDCEST